MQRITDVVKNLIIINVVVYIAATYLPMTRELLYPYVKLYWNVPHAEFMPVQFVTSMFMHGSDSHILFNMLNLFFLGPMVEQRLGPKKFLLLYLISGIAATALFLVFNDQAILVGASGAIFGVVAAFAMLFPDIRLMLLIPPIPIKGKYLALIMLVGGMLVQFNGNIAHLAHLGGALMGYGMIYYWKRKMMI